MRWRVSRSRRDRDGASLARLCAPSGASSLGAVLLAAGLATLGGSALGAAPARSGGAARPGPRGRATPRIVYPKLLRAVQAVYPPAARREGREAVVRLAVTVGSDGKVLGVQVVRSAGADFDAAAAAAARQFVYRPALVDGKPVTAKILVDYPFRLRDKKGPPSRPARASGPPSRTGARPVPRATLAPRRAAAPLSALQTPRPSRAPSRAAPRRPGAPRRRTTPSRVAGRAGAGAGRAVLYGRVREKGTRKPIPDAEVLVFSLESPSAVVARTFSAEDGRFQLPPLAPGRYRVSVRAAGCYPFRVTERLGLGARLQVDYFVERRSYDPYETVVVAKAARREVTRYTVALPEIQKIPGTQGDALRAIQNMPGVARASFGGGALVVRGAAPADTRVFIEGIEIPQLYHFFGLTSVVNSDMLRQIVFVPGNYSVTYGRALGGIIDVKLRDPRRDRWHGYADVDLWDVGLLVQGPVGKGGIALSARRSHIDAVLSVLPKSLLGADLSVAPVYYDYQALFTYPVLGGKLKALVFGSDDRVKVVFRDPTDLGPGAEGVKQTTLFHRALVAWSRRWQAHRLALTLSAGYQLLDFYISESLRFNLGVWRLNWRARYAYRVTPSLEVAVGNVGEYLWTDVSFSTPPLPAEGEIPDPIGSQEPITATQKDTLYSQALFAEATWKPVSRLSVVPGLRLDYVRLGTFRGWTFDPRITSKVEVVRKRFFLSAAVGLFHQEPFFPDVYEVAGGNPALHHSRALHASLGATWQIRDALSLETTAFYKHITDNIVSSRALVYRDGRVVVEGRSNEGIGRIYGAELLIKKRPDRDCPKFLHMESCFGWLSYTVLRSERKDHPGEPWRLFDFDQTHILTLILSGKWKHGWQVGLRFRLASGNPTTFLQGGMYDADADQYLAVPGPTNQERLPLFHQLDLRVDKKFVFRKWILSLYLDIQNVYNFRAKEFVRYNFNYTERGYVLGLPIIPSLGIKGSF